jgi:hypothetical protein
MEDQISHLRLVTGFRLLARPLKCAAIPFAVSCDAISSKRMQDSAIYLGLRLGTPHVWWEICGEGAHGSWPGSPKVIIDDWHSQPAYFEPQEWNIYLAGPETCLW